MSGPVNTLAQIWLWRLEAQVLGAVVVCLFLAIWVVVYALFGEGAGTGLIFAFFIGCGAVIVFSLGRALYLALSPGLDGARLQPVLFLLRSGRRLWLRGRVERLPQRVVHAALYFCIGKVVVCQRSPPRILPSPRRRLRPL
jgi:hypothetical protein